MDSSRISDDDFDWEAAVAEIDIACNRTSESTTTSLGSNGNFFESNCKVSKAAKQSTLDKYMRVQKDQSFSTNQNHPLSELHSKKVDVSRHHIDPLAAKTWTYPVNVPLRDYQYSIANTALFSNTLVALPTGLGKTLIAAVVMYNYFRWFPSGKIVFTAPSRPLVMQQIEACHNIVGIPQEWTIDMTGQMNPSERSEYWQKMRVFFVTPQVLEKDIQSGSCKGKELVCLVVDEAHRAVGNYSYCVVVRELMALEVDLRILALTATPGSKQASIQTVIDNLNISTLEHRDETDPDVVEYTHNRNIDLIPVTMPKESLNISSLLLSIVDPVVQKLCSLRVFYNRDLTKITPFELLTARDKFRHSPPSFISELQYGEVEGYFGTAVTLYHIYKLLFSHGVRPALEMLHQKLQPGAFARTMGRNEKVWQLKLSMQQNLKHGAPNPKLQKMEEIIKEHFDSNNPATTRVIIFTNFRESVKDIIESLQKLETGVKAVEFIGQSSGKACKGQTQKMQQEVLQKFRAGEFNIIVATSIGEEGLDIMEVDLVICFDANVSPIRMIQRIGRTGRKRDGRVVILASEGSELQGYMTKKAKGKALRKHMHNGGIQSFIFHSSPRMVPHCYQPQAELIEMSIEKFVPRRNKAKVISISKDSVTDSLTEAEANLLAKYFSGERDQHGWKPSLVAFPHCQLFPSCVAKIKHSFRTSEMLVHTLKLLQGQDISKFESQPRNSLDSAEYAVKDSVSQGLQDDDFEFNASLEPYPVYCIPDKTDVEEAENSFISMEEDHLPNSFHKEVISLDELDTVTGEEVITLKELDTVTGREVIHLKELDTVKNKELKSVNSSGMEKAKTNSSFLKTPVLHHCLFNTQYVYINEDGRVIIKPPPSLPIHKKLATKRADILSDSKNRVPQDFATHSLPVRSFVGEQAGVMLTENKDKSEEFINKPSCADKITIGLQNYSLQEPVIDRVHDPYNPTNSQNSPTKKLDEMQHCKTNNNVDKMVGSFEQFGVCSQPRDNQEKNTQENTRFSRPDNMLSGKPLEDSPKLPSKSLKVISGASRINKASALSDCNGNSVSFGSELKENVVSNCAPDSNESLLVGHIHGKSDLRNPISNSVLKDSTNHQRRDSRLQRKPSLDDSFPKYDCKTLSAADNIDVSISQMETRNTISNNISYVCNNANDNGVKRSSTYSIEDERQGAVLEALSTARLSASHTQISPLTIKNTCTQDWRLSIDETQQSGKKQRKFKRLRKVKEDAQKPSSKKNTKKNQHNTDSLVLGKQRISTDRGIPKRTYLPLIDEEAEVSSDEDVSTDEDNESENGSAEETDDSFIDDEIELSTSESDKVDMLAVYRRSLLTQSPFDRNINASVCIENMRDDGNEEQEPPISVDSPFDTVCSSGSETMETPYHASFFEDVKCESSSKDLNISYHSRFNVHIQSESGETDKFQELRKRKLDFQSINVTESSNYQGNFSCPANASSIKEVYSQPKHTSEDLISASLDDDFFTGIDLDALEAEATEKARLRSQMNVGYQQAASMTEPGMPKIRVSFPRSQGVDLQSIVNNCSDKNQTIALDENNDFVNNGFPRKRERTEDVDNDFLCIPSFNLGI